LTDESDKYKNEILRVTEVVREESQESSSILSTPTSSKSRITDSKLRVPEELLARGKAKKDKRLPKQECDLDESDISDDEDPLRRLSLLMQKESDSLMQG